MKKDASSLIYPTLLLGSSLPYAVSLLAQADRQLYFHFPRALVGHRIVDLVQLGQQAPAVPLHEAVRLDSRLVLVEALIGAQACHADVNARLGGIVIRVALPELRLAQHVGRKLDHVDRMVMGHLPGASLA